MHKCTLQINPFNFLQVQNTETAYIFIVFFTDNF